ncbi:KfrB domain-containing protein [Nitrosomonas sp. Is35]|uniref:KfrB domain-containing protein n=1 Tax=unclassified Nitrosomonas TaxID=2609265 RepID=UPI00294AFBC6|nr:MULTISPECIES: KfrB domain-containing protein [unclassified Nitrosomonas]MDV6342482.1 KfrB domain-containing protein [Nitrosomonas sp. Is24]MDV6348386.1 KfrB domain-containing protein [Nitrosomonas sp. Is35]
MTTPAKLRMIVMNGQKILQTQNNNEWETIGTIKKVDEGIKPGVYNIYLATAPVDKNQYEGQIIHVDKENAVFYQQVKKDFIVHQLNDVDGKPVAGKDVAITYDGEKATLTLVNSPKNKRILKI